MELAKTMSADKDVVICLSGRGDKGMLFLKYFLYTYGEDVQTVAEELPRLGPEIDWGLRF